MWLKINKILALHSRPIIDRLFQRWFFVCCWFHLVTFCFLHYCTCIVIHIVRVKFLLLILLFLDDVIHVSDWPSECQSKHQSFQHNYTTHSSVLIKHVVFEIKQFGFFIRLIYCAVRTNHNIIIVSPIGKSTKFAFLGLTLHFFRPLKMVF